MSKDKYFRDELTYLKEQGKLFSDLHPELARYLNGNRTDPDIERLLEGFAFLTGRLREKIDDEFPEFTHSMINMLWPNYLRPVPSYTIMQFKPGNSEISQRQTLPCGTMVDSNVVDQEVCHFRTCRDIDIYPFNIINIESTHSRESSCITVDIESTSDQQLKQIGVKQIEFYLGGHHYSSQLLYLWLNNYLDSIELYCKSQVIIIPKDSFSAVGFNSEDSVLPFPKNVYDGYRVIQEYLTFPEAFNFFKLLNINDYLTDDLYGNFSIVFKFKRRIPVDVKIGEDSFSLYCVPAINLFDHEADPIDLNGQHVEYKIEPSSRNPSHYEIFSIDHVEGWIAEDEGRARGEPRVYQSFESFQHEVERSKDRKALYYRIKVKNSVKKEGVDHYLSFVRGDETAFIGRNECISVSLTCSNRQLPIKLGKGDICVGTNNTPNYADFTNITEPSFPVRAVLDGSLLWTLISNLSLNYTSLLSKDAICNIIRSYNFKALGDRQAEKITNRNLEGIVTIDSEPFERIIEGRPVRGLKTSLVLDQDCFASEGELYLFSSVLNHFFSLYASINSFHELVVFNASNKETYSWPTRSGQQPLI